MLSQNWHILLNFSFLASDMTEMRTPPQPPTTLDLSAIALETSINDINSPITPIEGKYFLASYHVAQ